MIMIIIFIIIIIIIIIVNSVIKNKIGKFGRTL